MNNQGRHTLATISLVIVIVLSTFLMYNLVLALSPNQPILNSPTNASYIDQNSAVLNVTVTDPDGDTMNVTFFNASDNSQICNRTGITNGSYANCTWSSLSDGVYQWFVNVTDGTDTTKSNTWTFTIDTENPIITINSPTSNSFLSSKTISINLTATDSNLNYTNISIIQGGSIINSTTNTTNGTYLVSLGVSNDGVYNITTISYDLANNSNSSTVTNITVDTTGPTVTFVSPSDNALTVTTRNWTYINVTVVDSLTTVANCTVNWNGTVYNMTEVGSGTSISAYINRTNLANGNYSMNVTCNDTLGNNGSTTSWVYIDVNYNAPNSPTNISPSSGATNQPLSVNLNVTVTDDDGDNMNVSFYNNATGAQIGSTQTNIANGSTAQVTWSGLNTSTTYYWYVNVTDGTNTTQSSVYNFTTDARPVVSANATSPSTVYTNTSITVNITCTDLDNSTVTAYIQPYLNGSTDESVSSQLINVSNNTLIYTYGSSNFSKGDNITFELWCGDGVLNSTHINTTTITVSNLNPSVTTPQFNDNNYTTNEDIQVNVTYTDVDLDNGTVYFLWYKNGTNIYNQTNTSISNGTMVYSTLSSGNFSKNDIINVSVYANDGTDNSTLIWSSSKTIINTAPTFDFNLSNQSIYHSENLSYNINCSDVDNDILIYYDNSSLFNINSSTGLIQDNPTQGDVGNHSINITCSDGITNISQTFNYEIKNHAPNATTPIFNAINYTSSQDIQVNVTVTDPDGDTMDVTFRWYVNGTDIGNPQTNTGVSNGTTISASLSNSNYNKGDIINVSVNVTDSVDYIFTWSNTTTILNSAPNQITSPNSPANSSTGISTTPTLNVTVTDPDGDNMNVSIYNNATGAQICNRTNITNGSYVNCTWSGRSYSTTYYWYVNVTDGTNTTQSSIWQFTTTASSSSSSGSSSGGGGTIITDTNVEDSKTQVFNKLSKGETATIVINKEAIPVSEVIISPKEDVNNLEVKIESLKEKPKTIIKSPGSTKSKVYRYLSISSSNESVTGKIKFKVNRSWINENKIDLLTIRLMRYHNNNWEELPTKQYGANEDYYFFYATTSGFSYFSILADKKEETVTVTNQNQQNTEDTNNQKPAPPSSNINTRENTETENKTNVIFSYWYIWISILIIILVIILVMYVGLPNLNIKSKLHPPREISQQEATRIAEYEIIRRGIDLSKISLKVVKESWEDKRYWSARFLYKNKVHEILISTSGKVLREV